MCQNDECSGIKAERVVHFYLPAHFTVIYKKKDTRYTRLGDQQQSSSTLNCYYMYYI